MVKSDLINRHPFGIKGGVPDIIAGGQFGAVLSRAGVGKTALLVQLALNAMLRDQNVLHISMIDPVDKVTLWYEELFHHLSQRDGVEQGDISLESLLPHRFIMTFRIAGFSVPKLRERLMDLDEQNIFRPDMIIVDGLRFDESARNCLEEMKMLAGEQSLQVWFSVHTHRHENASSGAFPTSIADIQDLFDVALKLEPEETNIRIKPLKGPEDIISGLSRLALDASSMLIK